MLGISNRNGVRLRFSLVCLLFVGVTVFCSLVSSHSVFAAAKQSTITVNMTQGILDISLTPDIDGRFGKSANSTIDVNTDNYTGYSMKIVSTGSTSLVDTNDDEIQSINSAINESTFVSDNNYVNKWGYVPSQYIDENTIVSNTNYLPAPSLEGDLLAKTNVANSADDTYTLSFGAKVDHQLPPGTYQYTFVLQIVANPIVYNITYDDNTSDNVTNMPTPNPQIVNIDGGTPVQDSYATLSENTPIRDGKRFAGWCDVATTIDPDTGDDLCSGVTYSASSDLPIDQTAGPNITLYAIWREEAYVCKIAAALHTETCGWGASDSSKGCRAAGFSSGDTIVYGNIVESNTKVYGDAYNCDINYDGVFDENTERFYYIGEDGTNASLVYYMNEPDDDNYAWDAALEVMPDSTLWSNPNLISQGTKVARFMTVNEISTICNGTNRIVRRIDNTSKANCGYIAEQSSYAFPSGKHDTIWLDRVNNTNRRIHLRDGQTIGTPGSTSKNGVRPVIGVPLDKIEPYSAAYIISFDAHNETDATIVRIKQGAALGSNIPVNPTYTNHLFQGWFTADTGGTQINALTIPSSDTTYHAHWLKTTSLAILARDTIAVEPEDSVTINVTNSAELEPYTFSSSNTSIATVDSSTGEVSGVAEGTTTIIMTGSISGATKTITVNVTEEILPVTQAIIENDDLTIYVGEQTSVAIDNLDELEPYIFSSDNSSIATVDTYTGVITGVGIGVTNIIMTGEKSGLTKSLEVNVVAVPAIMHTVTFNANGGSFNDPSDGSKQVEESTAVGVMPTPTRSDYMFFGWYKDDGTFYQEVYPEEEINDDVTYYAKWIENSGNFQIKFAETNVCNFTGTAVSGDYCSHISDSSYYIDTNIKLLNDANYEKDFEIGFNIVEYSPSSQIPTSGNAGGSQATFVSSKAEDSANDYPGFVLRRSGTSLQLTARWKGDTNNAVTFSSAAHSVKISRRKEEATPGNITYKIYYTVDGVERLFQDVTDKTKLPIETKVWFGGAVNADGISPMRPLVAKLTDMYVKLEE
ncbi:InlB B-repeat-containing protein [Candidatus Saccharibacteria bacterium]|nr:InlB B-repeat-containing protein [Candidatus Saccharibacteria bacterium]